MATINVYGGVIRQLPPGWPNVQPEPTLSSDQKTVLTGTQDDTKFAAQVIGKDIPVFIGGQALMGCRIIEGPFLNTVDGAGYVDMIASPCMVATPAATTRELRSLRLNGTESFTSSDGGATWSPIAAGPFDAVEINVLYGTEEQTPFASSISRYTDRAVPYRSHICVETKSVPLAPFANAIPFDSVYVYESDFLTRNDGLLKLAEYCRFGADECEFEVSGQDTFWIAVKQSTFIGYLQDLQRSIGRNWNIVLSDKIRVFENTTNETPIALTRADVVADSIKFWQDPPESVPSSRNLGFVDSGRDNDFNSVKAVLDRFPIPLTASETNEELEIPVGMDATQATEAVNKSILIDEFARNKLSCKLLPHMRGIEPGDIIAPDFSVTWTTGRVVSVVRNGADYTTEITVERIEFSLLTTGPTITSSATVTIDEEDGVTVTTVTSDQEGTYSIVGGADAALFTIDPDSGDLEFLTDPDFEDPQDADTDNDYEVIVQVLSNGLTDTQAITVTVADVMEP